MVFSAVVFDLFHTIVDPEDFSPKDYRRPDIVAGLLGVDAREFSSYWSETLAVRNTSRSMTPIVLVEKFLERNGVKYDQDVMVGVDYELGRFQDTALLKPRPEIVSALRTIADRGIKMGLLTNCDEREVRQWPNSPIAQFFHAACFSFDIGVRKPELKAYQTVLASLGQESQKAVYVGDGGSNELEGANASGFKLTVFMEGFVASNGLRKPSEIQEFRKVADVSIRRLDELVSTLS